MPDQAPRASSHVTRAPPWCLAAGSAMIWP
jgi:hypothetical protein